VAQEAQEQRPRGIGKEPEISALAERPAGDETDELGPASVVDEAILSLPRKEQQCIVAYFFEGRNFREIAQRQRISETAVQKRVKRGLEKIRAFLERRGFKVDLAALPALMRPNVSPVARAELVQATLAAVHAALHGKGEANISWQLAERVIRSLAWRRFLVVGLPVLLLALGGSFLLLRDKGAVTPARSPPFQVTDNRIEKLGEDWSQVVQRAALLMRFPPGGPSPGDSQRAAYDQGIALVRSETARLARELSRALQEGREREQIAQFLTVELRETLNLDSSQQAEIFAQLRSQLSQGTTLRDGLSSLERAKADFGSALRQRLSPEQRPRFDQTYGTNASGVLALPAIAFREGNK
jgi:DNA-binding Lrp family transcriptional regulator